MKKLNLILAILLTLSLVLCGCSDKSDNKSDSEKSGTKSESIVEKDEDESEESDDGDSSDKPEGSTDSKDAGEVDFETAVDNFETPSEAKKIDTDKEDPSVKDMQFTYDDEGRIKTCTYKVNGQTYSASYSYKDNSTLDGHSAIIYTFCGDTVVDTATIKISDFDPSKGFTVIDGYYFKGYTKGTE